MKIPCIGVIFFYKPSFEEIVLLKKGLPLLKCIENLFSLIRGKWGFRDNPDPSQFRAAFRHVVIDMLFVHSKSSNCQEDFDKVLLNISNLTVLKKEKKIQPTSTISLPEQNVLAYIAGYVIKTFPSDCLECKHFLQTDKLPESASNSSFELLRNKAYKQSNSLIFPSEQFCKVVELFQKIFCDTFPHRMHMNGLLQRLSGSAKDCLKLCDKSEFQERSFSMVKLFMKVRLHHALKMSNIERKVSTGKRNRKVLKLMHLKV